jgi:hypothetical protein
MMLGTYVGTYNRNIKVLETYIPTYVGTLESRVPKVLAKNFLRIFSQTNLTATLPLRANLNSLIDLSRVT